MLPGLLSDWDVVEPVATFQKHFILISRYNDSSVPIIVQYNSKAKSDHQQITNFYSSLIWYRIACNGTYPMAFDYTLILKHDKKRVIRRCHHHNMYSDGESKKNELLQILLHLLLQFTFECMVGDWSLLTTSLIL